MREKRLFMYGIFGFILLLAMLTIVYAENIACYSDSDCPSRFVGKEFCSNNDVFKNFINSSCINPGTNVSYCSDTAIPAFLIDCGNNEYGSWNDNYCSNDDVYHSRTGTLRGCRVINPLTNISGCYSEFVYQEELVQNCANGCSNGICNNNGIACHSNSECGSNGFFGDAACQNNDVFQNFITYICNNPGTINSSCSNAINFQLKTDCGINYCGNYGANYCGNNNIYHSRTCYDNGCNTGLCFNNSHNEETLVQNCANGCSSGMCLNIICSNDSQCGNNGFTTNKYCENDDVYADYNEYKCLNPGTINSSCFANTTSRLFDRCEYKCEDGECYEKNPSDFNDYEFNDSEEPGYIYTGVVTGSNDNQTIQEINPVAKISNNSANKLSWNNLLWILVILVVVLLVLIIILVMTR